MWTQQVDGTRRREQLVVTRVGLGVLVAMVLVAGMTRPPDRVRTFLLAWQVAFEELDLTTQGLCREVRVAVDEMCLLYEEQSRWPTAAQLEAEGIPPFAPLLLVGRSLAFRWQEEEAPGLRCYLGRPVDQSGPALLVRLEESAVRQDPVHRRLQRADAHHVRRSDGTVVHASLWIHQRAEAPAALARPEREGWRQVVPGDLGAGP